LNGAATAPPKPDITTGSEPTLVIVAVCVGVLAPTCTWPNDNPTGVTKNCGGVLATAALCDTSGPPASKSAKALTVRKCNLTPIGETSDRLLAMEHAARDRSAFAPPVAGALGAARDRVSAIIRPWLNDCCLRLWMGWLRASSLLE